MSITLKKVRRQVAGFSLAMIIASMFAVGVAQAATFTDVQPSDWFYPYVEDLAAQGILNTSFTAYRPGDLVNRAEMAKLAVEAWNLTLETPTEAPFKDVALGQWYTSYIYTAMKNNVVGGYKDNQGTLTGYFGPSDALTREQAMKIISLAAPLTTNTKGGPHFPDAPLSRWSYEYVETGYNWSVVDGYPDGNFKPENQINRAEIAKMVSNALAPVIRPGAGFNVEDAYATSLVAATVCFSGDVGTGADVAANYAITDVDGVELAVSAVDLATDPMCVELTTATQTEGKSYDVVVTDVVSAADEALDIGDISFTGFSAVGTGGDFMCTAGEQPAGVSVPIGATGVPFTVVNCQASGDPVVLSSMTFHRFGAGDEGDLADVYLYEGDYRLTTGRSINSETQSVEFTGLNLEVTSTGVSLVVIADIDGAAAPASQHAFELLNADAVNSNASSVDGDFPIKGNLMTISGAAAGTVTIRQNGSLDDMTVGETGRVAQFELEASGTEAMELNRIALYVRGTCDTTAVNDFKLYVEGGSEVLAETATVGNKELATFVLDNPFVIPQGDSKIFYVEAKATCRNNETIKIYLDETTDLNVIGSTFGTGVRVLDALYNGSAPANFSQVTVKGSDFNVAFNGPAASDIAIGQDKVSCLDITISNSSGQSLDIKDWDVTLAMQGALGTPADGGLVNTTATPDEANYTLVKLVKKNADGTYGNTLLGPSELPVIVGAALGVGNDVSQVVTLSGTNTIAAGASFDAAIVFDTPSNQFMNGDKIRCSLANLAAVGADYIRDPNGDALGSESITPSSATNGNIFTMSASGLTLDVASTPSSRNYVSGTKNAELLGLTIRSGASLSNTIKSLTVQGYVDNDNLAPGVDTFDASGSDAADASDGTLTNLKDLVGAVALYNGTTKVSDLENVNIDGKVVFNNLNINVLKSTSINLVIKGDINASAPFGTAPDRLKFGVVATTDVVAIDSNGKNVPTGLGGSVVNNATNGGVLVPETGVIMTIIAGGSGTVADTPSSSATVLVGESKKELTRIKFQSTNEAPVLKDLQFGILGGSNSAISKIYIAPLSVGSCGAVIGDTNGYSGTNGIFTVTDIGVTIPDSTALTLCVLGDVAQVGALGTPPSEPVSGSGVGVALLNVTEVTGGSGSNISEKYVSTQLGTRALDVDINDLVATTNIPTTLTPGLVAVGDVVVIDQEMMLVTAVTVEALGDDLTVVRGFGNTVRASHNARTDGTADIAEDGVGTRLVGISTLAVNSTTTFATAQDAVGDTCLDLTATAPFQAGDVIAIQVAGVVEYMLVSEIAPAAGGDCVAPDDVRVVRGLYGSTVQVQGAGAVITRFPVHGDLFKLRRSKPFIAQLGTTDVPVTDLPGTARTKIFGFSILATGQDDVQFTNVNAIEVKLGGAGAGGVASCSLTDGVNPDYDTVAAPAFGATMVFNFTDNPLTVTAGSPTPVKLYVVCDTTALTAIGNNISAQLVKAPTTIQWSDGAAANINTDGALVITSTITGDSFTKP